jgi:hypothetical protein
MSDRIVPTAELRAQVEWIRDRAEELSCPPIELEDAPRLAGLLRTLCEALLLSGAPSAPEKGADAGEGSRDADDAPLALKQLRAEFDALPVPSMLATQARQCYSIARKALLFGEALARAAAEGAVEATVTQGAIRWRPDGFSTDLTVSERVVAVPFDIGDRVRVTPILEADANG